MKVYKYTIEGRKNTVWVSKVHQVVHTGLDARGHLCVWIEIDPNEPPHTELTFMTAQTGEEVYGKHQGAVRQGNYFWHVYQQ